MILLSFFTSVEFYVIMAVAAAAVIALAARPRTRGEAKEFLLGSTLSPVDSPIDESAPSIEFRCLDNGHVTLIRRGLSGISMSGAVSIAATFDGVDIKLEERLVDGSSWDTEAHEAVFDIDFLPQGRYHVRYNSQKTGLFVAFQLHVAHGIVATRILSR